MRIIAIRELEKEGLKNSLVSFDLGCKEFEPKTFH
jgi:hypothetical protein